MQITRIQLKAIRLKNCNWSSHNEEYWKFWILNQLQIISLKTRFFSWWQSDWESNDRTSLLNYRIEDSISEKYGSPHFLCNDILLEWEIPSLCNMIYFKCFLHSLRYIFVASIWQKKTWKLEKSCFKSNHFRCCLPAVVLLERGRDWGKGKGAREGGEKEDKGEGKRREGVNASTTASNMLMMKFLF